MKFADMTTKQLKKEAVYLHGAVYNTGCYGLKDLAYYDAILAVLYERGITADERHSLIFTKWEANK